MQKLIDLLNFFDLRLKLFVIVINNVNNNNTFKKKLKKILTNRNFNSNRKQNTISCFAHIINLIIQNFIKIIDSKIEKHTIIFFEKNRIFDIKENKNISRVIKKIY